jgi:protein-tyrosine phosphatase
MKDSTAILFVCLGNICRSPLAKAIFLDLVKKENLGERFIVDSCGTSSAHSGEGAHWGSVQIANKYNIDLSTHCSRQVKKEDFEKFDLIVAMDTQNKRDLVRLCPSKKDIVICIREYDKLSNGDLDVPDPYFGGSEGFEIVYQMLERSCNKLLDTL